MKGDSSAFRPFQTVAPFNMTFLPIEETPNYCYISKLFWVLFGNFDVFQKTISCIRAGRRCCSFWRGMVATK